MTKLLLSIKEDILIFKFPLFSRWSYLCLCKCLCSKFLSNQRCQNGMFSSFYLIQRVSCLIAIIPSDSGIFNLKRKLYFTLKLLFLRENSSDPSSTTWKQFGKSINCTICKRGSESCLLRNINFWLIIKSINKVGTILHHQFQSFISMTQTISD